MRQRFARIPISSSISKIDRAKCFELSVNAYYEKHSEPIEVLNGLQEIRDNNHAQKH